MMLRKSGPMPIFNGRKRLRQAVVSNLETYPPQPQGGNPGQLTGIRRPLQPSPLSNSGSNRGRGTSTFGRSMYAPHNATSPAHFSKAEQPEFGGKRGIGNRRQSCTMTNQKTGWEGPSRQCYVSPASAGPSSRLPGKQSSCVPSHTAVFGEDKTATSAKKTVGKSGQARGMEKPDKSLRVLTVPLTHLKHVFGMNSENLPQLMFYLFGIVDSAVVEDSATGGKSFSLRDETGRVRCVFCEIDRQMPAVRRGQWYRVVGVVKPSWQAVHCLSLRPASMTERQAARAASSTSTAVLNGFRLRVAES